MAKGWTEERRRKQAEIIRQNKPWEKSTGPKTQKGKDKVALNALKHGRDSQMMRSYSAALTLNAQFVKQVNIACKTDKRLFDALNKLKEKHLKSEG